MKLTNKQLKQIIKEELSNVLEEYGDEMHGARGSHMKPPGLEGSNIADEWDRYTSRLKSKMREHPDIYIAFDMYQKEFPERAEEMRQYLNHVHSYLARPV